MPLVTFPNTRQQVHTREGWAENGPIRLHYVESNSEAPASLTPVVYVHSALGTAEGFLKEMRALSPRRCVSFSLRGRGNSDAPEAGYSFDRNVSDVEAIVNHLSLENFCLMGWSVGATYSIAYASRHSDLVSGLILLDYPARHPKWPVGWAERWLSGPTIRDNPNLVRGLRGVEQESSEVVLWDALGKINCPILVIGGGAEGALLKQEHIEMYRQHSRKLEVVVFPDSGHNVSQPDYDRFIRTITKFLEPIDALRLTVRR